MVAAAIAVSLLYNLAGVTYAARAMLSPLVCAVLMPLSSVSVALLTCGAAGWAGRIFQGREARP